MRQTLKPVIFLSHVHEDAELVISLRSWLSGKLAGSIEVFVSSDKRESLPGGEDWWDKIRAKLKSAKLVLVLITQRSLERKWIYFESGGAYFLEKKTIPLLIGCSTADLQPPLSQLQAYDISQPSESSMLLQQIVKIVQVCFCKMV